MKRIAINGFGRIGRASLKVIFETPGLEIVAVNDLMDLENAAYLLRYDSVYGKYGPSVRTHENHLHVGEKKVLFYSEKDPGKLPWKDLNIDVVIESTGFFTNREDAEKHIHAGARTVIISGPTKSENTPTVVHGVNTADGKTNIFSCASCTTNNIGPIIEILGRRLGVKKAILNTLHAFTASQMLVDAPSKESRGWDAQQQLTWHQLLPVPQSLLRKRCRNTKENLTAWLCVPRYQLDLFQTLRL